MESKTKNLAIEGMVRDNIDVREMGLTFVGKEYSTPLGRIDILAADSDGNKIPIEIKIGCAGDSAVGQLLGYMKAVGAFRGIIIANEFSKRVEAISSSLGIDLYPFRFDVIISGESVVTSTPPAADTLQERINLFTNECCINTPNIAIKYEAFLAAYNLWHTDKYNTSPPRLADNEPVPDVPNTSVGYCFEDDGDILCLCGISLINTPQGAVFRDCSYVYNRDRNRVYRIGDETRIPMI